MTSSEDGYELGNGMVMTLARITSISQGTEQFVRFSVAAPLIGRMRAHGLAPVFKIFTARTEGARITLPTFDKNRLALPSWESDPTRPIARAYTALNYSSGDQHLTFDALDLGDAHSWIHRARVGDAVGIIGFKHELALSEDTAELLLVGDRSAKPAIDEILRSAPAQLRTTVIDLGAGVGAGVGAAVGAEHTALQQLRLALADASASTSVWIAGETQQVAAARTAALASGIAGERVTFLPYWHHGLSREDYDRALYRRYQAATDNGESLADLKTIARVELTPVHAAEVN